MARENTKYRSVNISVEKDARLVALAEKCGMNPNSLINLLAERGMPEDIQRMNERT